MAMNFPILLAAVEARAKHLNEAEGKDLWAIGAAVIKEGIIIGAQIKSEPAGRGRPDTGKKKSLEAAALYLKKRGHEYNAITLNQMASTVTAFPVSRRHAGLNFFIHAEARNPDLLDWVVKQHAAEQRELPKDDRETLSGRIVRDWVNHWQRLEAQKKSEKIEAAKNKKKAATTLDEKRAADEELKSLGKAMPTPKTSLPPPDKESQTELAAMNDILEIDVEASLMVKKLRANLAALHKMGEINPEFGDALIEHHEEVVEVAKQIVSLLKDSKLKRFPIIPGGKSA